ncbi:WG repeat-containing protein [Anaerocolumna xylanovorans]|uniref:WG containing repeat-containing protein n=1 Tax=Anaerocolumna xylanovorans DSM 12503 TaxID=1121345 RepID=A0A1M7YJL7_9FIRM|nr:WG repeat-containing protein [Anaerocolumna xylanovorans]SHO52819.1 WG containing repeat-containing protein [Anaerocolumna xylanovorans DSM 12503]
MRGTKTIVAAGIIVFFAFAWYTLFSNSTRLQKEYESCLADARQKMEMGITKDATDQYMKALSMYESLDLRLEIAEYYYKTGQYDNYDEWCHTLMAKYPRKKEGYEKMASYYQETEDYYECYDILNAAAQRKLKSEQLSKIQQNIYYKYELKKVSLEAYKIYSSGYYAVKKEEKNWGYCDARGDNKIAYNYAEAQCFTSSGLAPVKSMDGEFYLIDKDGNKKYVDIEKKKIEECSPLSEDKMAVKIDGRYCYVDVNFKKQFGDYDYATAFNNGVAAVKEGQNWFIINKNGEKIQEQAYQNVIIDEKQVAFRNSCAFVQINDTYRMINTKGEQVGDQAWEDAKLFLSDLPACVKSQGRWGFVDANGQWVIKPSYLDAKPFTNGLAPVRTDSGWGYIDLEQKEQVIPCEFDDAGNFNDGGCAWVMKEGRWNMLFLYRLNKR